MGRYKGGGKTPSEKLGGRCAGDLTILQVRSGFAPISAHLIFEEHFLPIFFGRQATGNERGTATGRQPLSLVQISSFPPGARVGGPGIAP